MRKSNEIFIGHRRYVTPNDQVHGKGGITVAFKQTEGGVSYSIARCNVADNFCKKTGRIKAIGRLEGGISRYLAIDTESLNPGQVADLVLDQACQITDEVIEERERQKEARVYRRMIGM